MHGTTAFICVLRLSRPEMFDQMTTKEEATINKHFDRLEKALGDGRLILAGPCLDGAFGIVVFQANSEEEAKEFMKKDPAVSEGIMTAELHPFRVSLIQKPY